MIIVSSAIPQLFLHESLTDIVFQFAPRALGACVAWGRFCRLGWLAVAAMMYFGYVFVFADDPKRSLFIGFSLSFFLYLGWVIDDTDVIAFPILIYGISFALFVVLPKFLSYRKKTRAQ